MIFDEVFSRFIEESPVSVMYRGVLENIFSAERLDRIFEETAQRQVSGELLFSTCADLLGLVVTGSHKSVNSAYRRRRKEVGVAVKSVYNKLAGIETAVSERMVRDTACDLAAIVEKLDSRCQSPLAGYEVRIVDGNHLPATDHRIKELRDAGAAPLPGHALAIWNPQTELIEDVLTNLPARVSGKKVARLYADRWQIEAAFRELATALRSEINTLGYPCAALFGFCLAVVSYNILNVGRRALRTASDKVQNNDEEARKFSTYYLSEEIAGVYRGMMIAIPAEHWTETFAALTPTQLARGCCGWRKRWTSPSSTPIRIARTLRFPKRDCNAGEKESMCQPTNYYRLGRLSVTDSFKTMP